MRSGDDAHVKLADYRLTTGELSIAAALQNALGGIRDAVRDHTNDRSGLQGLVEPIRVLGELSERQALPPEQWLIHLKRAITDGIDSSGAPPETRVSLRTKIVSFAIVTHYAQRAPALDADPAGEHAPKPVG